MSDEKELSIKDLIFPFFYGGVLLAAVKWVGSKSTVLAATIAGIPIGLISIYFISDEKTLDYSHKYFYTTVFLLFSIIIFYTLHLYTNLKYRICIAIAVLCWLLLVTVRYFITSNTLDTSKTN